MAHFAEIDENNIVLRVLKVDNEQEHRGQQFLADDLQLGGTWIQTSYNTYGGHHVLGGTPMRMNYAGIGYTYDSGRDAFIPPKPFESWLLDEDTCLWGAPVPYPTDDKMYCWNEDTFGWVEVPAP